MRPILILFLLIAGCATAPRVPPRTQLELREMQTRAYESKDTKLVMKAVINALQDDGFMVRSADRELGFISAAKEVDVEDATEAFMQQLFAGAAARYRKNSTIEASVNVSEFGRETRVRVVFQTKVVDNFNMPITTAQVEDPVYYRDFFAKVDKSVFIARQGI